MSESDPTFNLSTKATIVRQTEAEKETVQKRAKEEGTEEVNIWRRAMRMYLKAQGYEIPDDLFADRGPGNRLPKGDLPTKINERQVITAVSEEALAAAS